ncbi:MAG: T9SS type A sorting domain-containing protein [Bacteroidetes bacterium]|nr:T9SS type A sorting domain-containing protein [Bacteroidota bacterium]
MKTNLTVLLMLLILNNALGQFNAPDHDHFYCSHSKVLNHGNKNLWQGIRTELLSDYDVTFYFLDVAIENNSVFVEGNVTIEADVIESQIDTVAFELIADMTVDSVKVNGIQRAFLRSGDETFIILDTPLLQGEHFSFQVFYYGTPPQGSFFSGMSTGYSSTYQKNVTWSLSEPYAAKEWWPTKQDLTDKADSSWVFITTSDVNMAGSQGLLTAITPLPGNKLRYEWKSRYPIDYYLISVAVADYQEYNIYAKPESLIGDSILIQNFIYDHPNCLPNYKDGIDRTASFIELFSDLYGLYPFWEEKYGHCLTQLGGGMEHQTMTTIGGFGFGLVAHELGHMWFGDNVTCATWSDIWINEGFATYTDYLAHEKIAGPPWPQIWLEDTHENVLSQPDGSVYVPEDELGNIWRIFSGRLSYDKGASIVHMIRFELQNDSVFFNVLKEFQDIYADSVATGVDFKEVLEDISGMDFTDFFDQWYFGEGYPVYEIVWNQDAGNFNMEVTQSTSTAITPLFKMLMPYRLIFNDGTDTTLLLYQNGHVEAYSIPFAKQVEDILVDPDNWVLEKVSSINVGYDEIQNPMHFSFGPNPVMEQLNIFLTNPQPSLYKINIIDHLGRVIYTKQLEGNLIQLNTSSYPSGTYLILLQNGNELYQRKFIKF